MKIKVGYGAAYGRLFKLSAAVFALAALTSCKEIPNSVHTEKRACLQHALYAILRPQSEAFRSDEFLLFR